MTSESGSATPEVAVRVPLSVMDAVLINYGFVVLYVLPPSENEHDTLKLQNSFYNLVNEDYTFLIGEMQVDSATGRVHVLQSPDVRRLGASGIRFELETKSALTSKEVEQSLDWVFMPGKLAKTETIAIKCTSLADGGVAVGITLNHTLMDGEGLFTFMKAWGQRYSGVAKENQLVINHDRHLLSSSGSASLQAHPEVHVATTPPSGETIHVSLLPSTTQQTFHVSKANMAKIKALAASAAAEDPPFVSTLDVITALFVMLISRARAHGQDARVTTGVNARRRLDPPLPINFAGNCVFSALSTYSKTELLSEDETSINPATLIKFALRIRSSILKLNSDYLRDTIDFIAEQENLSRVAVSTKYILGPDLMFTSWANLGLYDAEFDGVHPVFAGVPKVPFLDGMVIISESTSVVEGLDVLVFLECSAMDRLKALCGRVEYLHVQ